MSLDRSQPIPVEIAERAALLPDAQWRRFVSAMSHALIDLEREIDDAGRPASRGIGRRLTEAKGSTRG